MKSFSYWLRTGDMGAVKAALQVGSPSEGGVIVPDDFYATIVAKRNEASWLRNAGVQVLQTSRDVLAVPYQSSTDAKFVVAAEEGAYSEVEPTLDQVQITVHKWTNLIKVSEELLEDEQANLEAFLAAHIAEKMALTEGYYAVLGSGSSQHLGITAADSDTVTIYDFASAAQIEPAEVMQIPYQVNSFYRGRGVWTMSGDTESYLRGLETSNHFAFPAGPEAGGKGFALTEMLGRPVANQDGMASIAASAKVIVFGDWSQYFLVEHGGLTIARNPYLYQANGQVGIFSRFRQGGAPIQYEAFVVARQSA
jgi:HK97 family phage major capsid protein